MRQVLAVVLCATLSAAPVSAAAPLRASEAPGAIPELAQPALAAPTIEAAALPASDAVALPEAGNAALQQPTALGQLTAIPPAESGPAPSSAESAGAGLDRTFDGTADQRPAPGTLENPMPGRRLSMIPLGRSWAHAVKGWRGRRALRVPMTAFDHHTLIAYSFTLPALLVGALLWAVDPGGPLLGVGFCAAVTSGLFGSGAMSQHMVDVRDVGPVRRNALRYAAGAPREWDEDILGAVRRFEEDTGWKAVWTDSKHVLIQADRALRQVQLSVGWALKSDDPGDRRRLAYLFDGLNTRVGNAIRSTTAPYEPRAGTLEDPLPGPDVPRVSLTRSLRHANGLWYGRRALRLPLGASDHVVLSGLSFVVPPTVMTMAALVEGLSPEWTSRQTVIWVLGVAAWGIICGAMLALGHLKSARDGAAVMRNARRYATSAPREWDERVLDYVRRFEKDTGWRVLWTDSEHVLAQGDAANKRVLLSIGWVFKSAEKRDRRRIAYLWDTLNLTLGWAAKSRSR